MGLTHRVLVTGGTGLVGRFITEHFLARGNDVIVAGRTPPTSGFFSKAVGFREIPLDPEFDYRPLCADTDLVVHGAFAHVPGRYRGGEGDDPEGFRLANLEGSARLFRDAKEAGVRHCVFLSSRAVYGSPPPGTPLSEDMADAPDTLYGQVKLDGERHLNALINDDFIGVSLRITGVYGPTGPGIDHKWVDLFDAYGRGETIAPRAATEVHGKDVAEAVHTVITAPRNKVNGQSFNVSDVLKDTRDILAPLAKKLGTPHLLPPAGDRSTVCAMATDRLRALGWSTGGDELFDKTLAALAEDYVAR